MSHKLIFERVEKGRAYFKDEENKTIVLPDNYIIKGLSEGDEIFIELSKENNLAKDILNELLDTDK